MAKASKNLTVPAAVAVAVTLLAGSARAEVIELLDKTKMNGKVIHFTAWQSADGGENKQTLFQYGTGSGESGIQIVGAGNNGVRVTFDSDDLAQLLNEWSKYDITSVDDDDRVIGSGPLSIAPAFQ